MQADVIELRDFYASPLGEMCARVITDQIRQKWPDTSGGAVFGVGFPTPFFAPFKDEALRLGALMPASQGVLCWPETPPYHAVLVDTDELPLPTYSADFMLVVHALEMTRNPQQLLKEIWRVLRPDGRAIFVVANRLSPWAILDRTPFGHGQPYSHGQLDRLLKQARFLPEGWSNALFFPPSQKMMRAQRYFPPLEHLSAKFWPGFSGVFIVETTKQVYATRPKNGLRVRRPRLGPILLPDAPRPARLGSIWHEASPAKLRPYSKGP